MRFGSTGGMGGVGLFRAAWPGIRGELLPIVKTTFGLI